MRRLLAPILVAGFLSVSACAMSPQQPDAPGAVEGNTVFQPGPAGNGVGDIAPEHRRAADLIYNVLVGEIAGYRQALEMSVGHYAEAAALSEDPAVAARAARIALFAKDYARAVEVAQRWVKLAPDDLDARRTLALAHVRAGNLDGAVGQLEALVQLAGNSERGFYLVGRVLARDEQPQAALEVMARLVKRHPRDRHALYAYAHLAVEAEKLEVARLALDQALELQPGWPEASVLRARVLMDQGRPEAALRAMAATVGSHPDSKQLRINYARLLAETENYEQAREQFEILLKANPEDPELLYSMAVLAAEGERYDMAQEYLKRLVDTGQRVNDAYYYLGVISETQERHEEAIKWYSRVRKGERLIDARVRVGALKAKQGDVDGARDYLQQVRPDAGNEAAVVRLYLAEVDILRQAGQYAEALKTVNKALARAPDDADLLYARAMVAEKLDRLDVLERDLKQILVQDPDNAHALNALGYTLADRTRRYQEALEYIERALELSPQEPAILDSMGWVQYRLGNLEEAASYLRRAYAKDQDPEIAAHLGEVLWVSGDQGAARKIWQEALDRAPASAIVRETMQRLVP